MNINDYIMALARNNQVMPSFNQTSLGSLVQGRQQAPQLGQLEYMKLLALLKSRQQMQPDRQVDISPPAPSIESIPITEPTTRIESIPITEQDKGIEEFDVTPPVNDIESIPAVEPTLDDAIQTQDKESSKFNVEEQKDFIDKIKELTNVPIKFNDKTDSGSLSEEVTGAGDRELLKMFGISTEPEIEVGTKGKNSDQVKLTTLHEIAHNVLGHRSLGKDNEGEDIIDSKIEREAWSWAIDKAKEMGVNIDNVNIESFIPKEIEFEYGKTQSLNPQDYDSLEEFVKAQKPVYHVGKSGIKEFKLGKTGAVYFGNKEDVEFLKELSQGTEKGEEVYERYVILKNPYKTKNVGETAFMTKQKIEELKSQGYDGMISDKGETVAFSPDQIKTKAELTDIYNKGKGKKEVKFDKYKNGMES